MKVKFWKRSLWALNTILVAGIVAIAVFVFFLGGARIRLARAGAEVLGRANLPRGEEKIKRSTLPPAMSYRYIYDLPISGQPPVTADPAESPGETAPVSPLARNYRLAWTMVDFRDFLHCYAHLVRRDGAKPARTVDVTIGGKVEDWKLVMVRKDEADFENTRTGDRVTLKAEREAVPALAPAGSGETNPRRGPTLGTRPEDWNSTRPPREMVEKSPGVWEVPRQTARWWGEYGEERLQDVSLQPVVNPKTKKPMGLQVRSIKKGSILERRGIRKGDILRSINGHRVGSRQEAIAYLKGEGRGLTRYVVEIDRDGRILTLTYNVHR